MLLSATLSRDTRAMMVERTLIIQSLKPDILSDHLQGVPISSLRSTAGLRYHRAGGCQGGPEASPASDTLAVVLPLAYAVGSLSFYNYLQ